MVRVFQSELEEASRAHGSRPDNRTPAGASCYGAGDPVGDLPRDSPFAARCQRGIIT